ASTGQPLSVEFQVNTHTVRGQLNASVAIGPEGEFVVVWGSLNRVFGRRFGKDGRASGAEFRVTTYSLYEQKLPSIAIDLAGAFVVVWTSEAQDGDGTGIFAQRFDDAGNRLATEFQVNAYTVGPQLWPKVTALPAGDFVVAWEGAGSSSQSSEPS